MTTEEALTRLLPEWALSRGEDYQTDEVGWVVSRVDDGEMVEHLGWGITIPEAIEAAEAKAEQDAREQTERIADRHRRRASGELTERELASEKFTQIWAPMVLEIESQSVLFPSMVNRGYESDLSAGDTIQIRKHEYKSVTGLEVTG